MGSLKTITAVAKDPFYFLDSTHISIEEKNNTLFQSLSSPARSEKFDIAFGAGIKAQTYGYWKEDKLYQLPLTWFTGLDTWANSPGFPATHARFNRMITSRCFECHASYIKRDFEPSGPLAVREVLGRNSIIYGIDCERCHGPALEHVRFQQDNPTIKTAKFITRITSLGRGQQLDLCATCHSGNDRETQRSLFTFVPGDTLAHFYYPTFGEKTAEPDVHGQQLQMLHGSKCFAGSELTCSTCHSTHATRQTTAAYVTKCLDCHRNSGHATVAAQATAAAQAAATAQATAHTTAAAQATAVTTATCIDCHMPLVTSKTIVLNNGAGAKTIPYLLRTHKISIYK